MNCDGLHQVHFPHRQLRYKEQKSYERMGKDHISLHLGSQAYQICILY
jgi:hypothetical protein